MRRSNHPSRDWRRLRFRRAEVNFLWCFVQCLSDRDAARTLHHTQTMNRPIPQQPKADWINRRLTLGIFLAAAGRGGAYLTWFAILCIVAYVIAKSLDGAAWLRGRRRRTTRG
jgi:hypothetical protein